MTTDIIGPRAYVSPVHSSHALAVHVDLSRELRPIRLERTGDVALLVVFFRRALLGIVAVESGSGVSVEAQWQAIRECVGETLWRALLRYAFERSARGSPPVAGEQSPIPVVRLLGGDRARVVPIEPLLRAGGELVAVLEPGTELHPDQVRSARMRLEHPQTAVVIGDTVPRNGLRVPLERTRAVEPTVIDGARATASARQISSLAPGPWLARRALLLEAAGERADVVPSAQLLRRILAAGRRVIVDPTLWAVDAADASGSAVDRNAAAMEGAQPRASMAVAVREPPPRVSVVVPSYNRKQLLGEVVSSLARQTVPVDQYEVIVVLDGSTDGSRAQLAALNPRVRLRVIAQRNAGLPAARNRGVAEASEPVVVFLDDDLVPARAFVEAHAEAHAGGDPRVVAIGRCTAAVEGGGRWGALVRSSSDDHFDSKQEEAHPWGFLDYSAGNSSLRRTFLATCGGFDERFRTRNEEHDLGLRLLSAGAAFRYVREATAEHRLDGRRIAALRAQRLQGYYDLELVRKHPSLRHRIVLAEVLAKRRGGLSRAARTAIARPQLVERLLPAGAAAATCLDAVYMRDLHDRLMGSLMTAAYLAGVGAHEHAESLIDDVRRAVTSAATLGVELDLGSAERVVVPNADAARVVQLTWRGHYLVAVAGAEPGREWNWARLRERALARALPPLRRQIALADFLAAVNRTVGEEPD
ncbi:MAG TPA: glycosyltransferase [Solirubrobacteraceae bacterium]|nr:glycosyltransferase [Solirubrobacteraceae bacterium]